MPTGYPLALPTRFSWLLPMMSVFAHRTARWAGEATQAVAMGGPEGGREVTVVRGVATGAAVVQGVPTGLARRRSTTLRHVR